MWDRFTTLGRRLAIGRGRRTRGTSPHAEGLEGRALLSTADPVGSIGPVPAAVARSEPFDLAAPRVQSVIIQPRLGQILVTFQNDAAGLDRASLTDPSNYALARGHVGASRPLAITGLTAAPPTPEGTQTVVLQVQAGRRLSPGNYVLTIRSGGVRDRAGHALDGEFTRRLPSGDGQPGGDFAANLPTNSLSAFMVVPKGPYRFFGYMPFPRTHPHTRHDHPPERF